MTINETDWNVDEALDAPDYVDQEDVDEINLIDDPEYADILAELRQELANEMYMTRDTLLQAFEQEFGIRGVEIRRF